MAHWKFVCSSLPNCKKRAPSQNVCLYLFGNYDLGRPSKVIKNNVFCVRSWRWWLSDALHRSRSLWVTLIAPLFSGLLGKLHLQEAAPRRAAPRHKVGISLPIMAVLCKQFLKTVYQCYVVSCHSSHFLVLFSLRFRRSMSTKTNKKCYQNVSKMAAVNAPNVFASTFHHHLGLRILPSSTPTIEYWILRHHHRLVTSPYMRKPSI